MTRLEELLLLILDRAKKNGIDNLSKFQIFKIPYILQVLSIKYAGTQLLPETTFLRDQNGPISIDIYAAIENLEKHGYVKKKIEKKEGYDYARHGHSLAKAIPRLGFSIGEVLFLDNFLAKLLPLTQKKLKEFAYSTEPMEKMQDEEKGVLKKGAVMDFSSVVVDPDIIDVYSDAE